MILALRHTIIIQLLDRLLIYLWGWAGYPGPAKPDIKVLTGPTLCQRSIVIYFIKLVRLLGHSVLTDLEKIKNAEVSFLCNWMIFVKSGSSKREKHIRSIPIEPWFLY